MRTDAGGKRQRAHPARPGVGPKTAKALMNQFKSVAAVREASTAALENTPGVGPLLAQTIYEYFHT